MRKNTKNRIISVLAIGFSLMMSFSSCSHLIAKEREAAYLEGQRLEVEQVDVEYTAEQFAEITERLTRLVNASMIGLGALPSDGDNTSEIKSRIENTVMPSIIDADISYADMLSLTEDALKVLDNGEAAFDLEICNKLYLMCMSRLGREKSGHLIYRYTIMYLEHMADIFEKRYAQYGYDWYLDDAGKYRKLASDISDTLGELEFTDAMSIAFFTVSAISGTPLVGEGSDDMLHLDSDEMLVLLKKQAAMIADHKMSEAQWVVVTSLLYEICFTATEPRDDWKDAQKAEWNALKSCPEYFERLGKIMPRVSELYVAAVSKMDKNSITVIMSNSADAASFEILRLFSLCEKEFLSVAKAFELSGKFESLYELEAMDEAGATEDFTKYSKYRKSVNSGQLFDSLKQCAFGQIEVKEFRRVYENYMFSNAPYITYAFIFLNR